mmetsp:Transcript_63500/g.110707  ORF Transcript_63500/g.110707 Transcript_63500/m.110707 type:complete len:205 (-) Transcript_63500:507-1121(-)
MLWAVTHHLLACPPVKHYELLLSNGDLQLAISMLVDSKNDIHAVLCWYLASPLSSAYSPPSSPAQWRKEGRGRLRLLWSRTFSSSLGLLSSCRLSVPLRGWSLLLLSKVMVGVCFWAPYTETLSGMCLPDWLGRLSWIWHTTTAGFASLRLCIFLLCPAYAAKLRSCTQAVATFNAELPHPASSVRAASSLDDMLIPNRLTGSA